MVKYCFKNINVIPDAVNLINIILSLTQRKTPTIIHSRMKISQIRQFYMRKIKYTQTTCNQRISQILTDLPKLDNIHPFFSDLFNVLYDKDNYKLALGQLNTCRSIIDKIGKNYIKLIKYADSLYRCKKLKRSALGRMVTIIKKQNSSLNYLEQVRQHLSRIPQIDPDTRTLILTGFPNVGKSSFINKITRANVEVCNYAFTTRSLYVGHMDYNYLRWQVIDSPGILDRSLEERNIIEMQSITALAHLNACVLFILDLDLESKYTIKQQCQLFHSLKPLWKNKPVIFICNKSDIVIFIKNKHINIITFVILYL
jgi:nucleolar GTP-binding protein